MTFKQITAADPRRWQLKKLISNMVDEDFNYWYNEIMSWGNLTAEELVEEVLNLKEK
ncbi:MAG: hypothetical protein ACOC56_02305 [Atribacterota bacterium]